MMSFINAAQAGREAFFFFTRFLHAHRPVSETSDALAKLRTTLLEDFAALDTDKKDKVVRHLLSHWSTTEGIRIQKVPHDMPAVTRLLMVLNMRADHNHMRLERFKARDKNPDIIIPGPDDTPAPDGYEPQ